MKKISSSLFTTFCISYNSGEEKRTLPPSFQSSPQDPKRAKLATAKTAGLLLMVFVVLHIYIFKKDNLWYKSLTYFIELVCSVRFYWRILVLFFIYKFIDLACSSEVAVRK